MIIFVLNSGYSFTILASFMHFIEINLSPNPVQIRKAKKFKILIQSESAEIAKLRSN